MKKILALLLALVMVFALAACGGEGGTTTSADPNANNSDNSQASGDNVIKIGVFEPLTGDSGPGGKQEMLGMQYAHSLAWSIASSSYPATTSPTVPRPPLPPAVS